MPCYCWRGEVLLRCGIGDRFGELQRSIEAIGFGAERSGQSNQPGSGDVLEVPARELLSDAANILGERAETVLAGKIELFGEGFDFQRAQILDAVVVFAAPGEESVFVDVELGGDTTEGPALRAEFDEPVDDFVVFH